MNKIAIIITAIVLGAIFQSYAIFKLWIWFIVPIGLPAITMAHALGLITITNALLASRGLDTNLNDTNEVINKIIAIFTIPLITLGIGAIAHFLMGHGY